MKLSAPALFVITASNPEAYQHYIDTIENGFMLETIQDLLQPHEYDNLRVIYGGERVYAWGAMPGLSNIRTWKRLRIGDRILIYRKGNYEYYATVTYKLHNPDLARKLWKEDKKGDSWDYMYFLNNVTEISVPLKEYNRIFGFAASYHPTGFGPVSKKVQDRLLKEFKTVDRLLDFLQDGDWIKSSPDVSADVKDVLVAERASREVEKISLHERNVEDFVADRVGDLEVGLTLVARQLDTREVGRLDLLCRDHEHNWVVVELKKDKAGSSIIDQTQRYMGWVKRHRAQGEELVRGIIVVRKKDTALEYAISANPHLKVKVFSIHFED